jgi:hypothetical protein
MSTMKQDPLVLGLLLIGGAMLYSKSVRAQQVAQRPAGYGSMPGSAGTGLMQNLGGMLGNLFAGSTGNSYTPAVQAAINSGMNYQDYSMPGTDSWLDLTANGITPMGL